MEQNTYISGWKKERILINNKEITIATNLGMEAK
jgi:hypothetical protein